jgi:hypothetical protein
MRKIRFPLILMQITAKRLASLLRFLFRGILYIAAFNLLFCRGGVTCPPHLWHRQEREKSLWLKKRSSISKEELTHFESASEGRLMIYTAFLVPSSFAATQQSLNLYPSITV